MAEPITAEQLAEWRALARSMSDTVTSYTLTDAQNDLHRFEVATFALLDEVERLRAELASRPLRVLPVYDEEQADLRANSGRYEVQP